MLRVRFFVLAVLWASFPWRGQTFAQDQVLPPGDTSPRLRLETGGPRSYVSGLGFSPDGKHLYATGWDKAVQVWNQGDDGKYEFSPGATLRVPTGAGLYGGLNALAISSDGTWLATAGQGYVQGTSGERDSGWVTPAALLSEAAQLDEGLIYVFNTAKRTTTLLRGHRGPVQSVAFVRGSRSATPEIVSVAEERVDGSVKLQPVVRFWDVVRATEVASLKSAPGADGKKQQPLPGLQGFRPGVAAWSTGAGVKQARVALAWGDDQFRIWDVDSGQVAVAKSNPNLLSILSLPGPGDRLLTGAHAEIGIWSPPAFARGKALALNSQQFQRAAIESVNGRTRNLPSALALIPGRGNSPANVACVVTKYLDDGQAEYRLVLAGGAPLKTIREFPLPWKGEIRQPALAVSADGSRLAVAGNDRNEIEVYGVDELLKGQDARPQRLASVGLAFRHAIFVRRDDAWGLRLSEDPRRPETNAIVADLRRRIVLPADDEWQSATMVAEGWSADSTGAGMFTVRRPGQPPLNLPLEKDYVATSYAFCPPSPACPVPLIAVASDYRGQPMLQVFRGDTGDEIRWCVGHTGKIRSLSFSDDGRMLVSAAEDRTVAVWTMTDLVERTLDLHGRFTGVSVHRRDQNLVVIEAPTKSSLKPGDEITGLHLAGETKPIASVTDFYELALSRRPGEVVELSVRRGGNLETVSYVVGQAADEVKPLFTLFVAPAAKQGEWQWIAWHPLGNFDANGDDVDRWLGWHFNTGEPEQPARFAAIGEYRDDFYRTDLLESLIENQKLVVNVVEEDPRLSVWLRYHDGTPVQMDVQNTPIIQSTQLELVAEVSGVSERSLQGLEVAVDGAAPIPLAHVSGREWTADLSGFEWRRGRHRVAVRLRTRDREMTELERVEFRPAAPTIDWQQSWSEELKQEQVQVTATVVAASEPTKVQLLLREAGKDEPVVLQSWETDGTLKIDESVSLQPGENRVELVSWNASVPEAELDRETSRIAKLVRRAAPAEAPRIVLDEVAERTEQGDFVPLVADDDVYHTVRPTIRVRGKLSAGDVIESASIQQGQARRDLTKFQANQARDFSFDEELTLEPGSQPLVIRAAIGAAVDEKRLTVVFDPPPPRMTAFESTVTPLRDLPAGIKAERGVLYAGYHEPLVALTATLEGGLDLAYRADVVVNDQALPADSLEIDRSQQGRHRLTAKVPLAAGRNTLALRVSNAWSDEVVLKSEDFSFLRPPEMLEVEAPAVLVGEPLTLSCRVRSELPLRWARLTIDDRPFSEVMISEVDNKPGEWLLKVENVGLEEGEHVLSMTAVNDDGPAFEPARHQVRLERPRVRPPVLTLVSPAAHAIDMTVNSNSLEIQYALSSTEPATVLVKVQGKSDQYDRPGVANSIDGTPITERLDLFEGINQIELEARNSGGFSEKQSFQVTFVPKTSAVEIVSVGDQRPRLRNDGTGDFDKPAPTASVKLAGKVDVRARKLAKGALTARIWVNKYMLPTVPVALDPQDSSIGRFESEILLSQAKGNLVQVEVFDAEGRTALEVGCTNELRIDCLAPELKQDLYLLLLGDGDAQGIRDDARRILRAQARTRQQASQELWESDAFARIYVHEAVNAAPAAVQYRLRDLVGKMNGNLRQGSRGSLKSIVMVYYYGRITLLEDDFAFGAGDATKSRARITGRILEDNLARSYGAHVICLDLFQVDGSVLEARDVWPKAPHLGIYVSCWKGKEEEPKVTMRSALEQVVPRSRDVGQVGRQLDELFASAQQQFRGQIENLNLFGPVSDLRLSAAED